MMYTPSRLYPLLLSGALALAPIALPAQAADGAAARKASTRSTPAVPPRDMPQYGKGEHGRYLVLRLENSRGAAVAPGTPYRLFLTAKGQSIENTPSQDGILEGVTDALGRSAWVWTREAHPAEDFTLVRMIGDGAWGHFFQLQSGSGSKPLAG